MFHEDPVKARALLAAQNLSLRRSGNPAAALTFVRFRWPAALPLGRSSLFRWVVPERSLATRTQFHVYFVPSTGSQEDRQAGRQAGRSAAIPSVCTLTLFFGRLVLPLALRLGTCVRERARSSTKVQSKRGHFLQVKTFLAPKREVPPRALPFVRFRPMF